MCVLTLHWRACVSEWKLCAHLLAHARVYVNVQRVGRRRALFVKFRLHILSLKGADSLSFLPLDVRGCRKCEGASCWNAIVTALQINNVAILEWVVVLDGVCWMQSCNTSALQMFLFFFFFLSLERVRVCLRKCADPAHKQQPSCCVPEVWCCFLCPFFPPFLSLS